MAPVIQNTSSIAMALAGMTASVDIPTPRDGSFWNGRDSFATVAARSLPTKKQSGMLPTPPNSISPSLPPQAFNKGRTSAAPPTPPAGPTHVDSDIDLQDAVDHAKAQDQPQRGLSRIHNPNNLSGLDTTGAITPALLAKHHLPAILLTHGPLAIRHIMGHLTTTVPGFSGIPPAKARRLVVGALEGRGSGGEPGGLHGDVDFEKVGWGRWDAKQRGQPPRTSSRAMIGHSPSHLAPLQHSPPPNALHGLRIPTRRHDRPRPPPRTTPSLSHDSEMDYDPPLLSPSDEDPEDEADKMSLDERDSSCSSSEYPDAEDDDAVLDDELGDVTDEEDWASIGAAALRQGSVSKSIPLRSAGGLHGGGGGGMNPHLSATTARSGSTRLGGAGGGPAPEALAKSMPGFGFRPPCLSSSSSQFLQQAPRGELRLWGGFEESMPGVGIGSDSQEREAVEALLRLSSV